MKKSFPLILLAVALAAVARAAQPDLNSAPVPWAQARAEGATLSLKDVFSISLPDGGEWKKQPAPATPTGASVNVWEIAPTDGPGFGMLIVMDVAIEKVAEAERDTFTRDLANGFRRTGIEAMQRKGYVLEEFKVEKVESKWPRSVKAISRFRRGTERQVNVTYFFPASRVYILGYEGTFHDEPAWFIRARRTLEAR
jgi:hypothetical protein